VSGTMKRKTWGLATLAAVAIVGVGAGTPAWLGRKPAPPPVPFETIDRRDIAQSVDATGTVQPVEIVEIKSKASGQILALPVELGSNVHLGELLAQIDTVTVRNQYHQALAALQAAQASVQVTKAQKQRADDLYSREVMTVDQYESAILAAANALSSQAAAHSNLEIARQAMNDADVRAPSDGTVIELDVTKGQVIASATASASGGTTLLKMANLNRVRMQALVGETDIGNVRAGLSATVTVDAFPNRPFRGLVEKIEPQAVVQQSVTMFPVLVDIANENGLLLPGMNGEVNISIAERPNAIAVPVDAVRGARQASAVAPVLGLEPDSVRAQVQRELAARRAARMAGFGGPRGAAGDSSRASGFGRGAGRGSAGGSGGGLGEAGGGAGARGMGARPNGAGRGGWAGRRGGGGGASFGGGIPDSVRGAGGFGGGGAAPQVVFVKTASGVEPRLVRLGVSDFDYAEVLDGLKEGDEVAILSIAEAQAKRQQDLSRAMQRSGAGMPGMSSGTGGRGAGTGGGR